MITELEIGNFRGIGQLKLEEMQPLTLITGKHNSGKTSVLEAVLLLLRSRTPEVFAELNAFRGCPSAADDLWDCFQKDEAAGPFTIRVENDGEEMKLSRSAALDAESVRMPGLPVAVRTSPRHHTAAARADKRMEFSFRCGDYEAHTCFHREGPFIRQEVLSEAPAPAPVSIPVVRCLGARRVCGPDLAVMLGEVELGNRKDELVEILRIIEPNLRDVFIAVHPDGGSEVCIRAAGERPIPLALAGAGLQNLCEIAMDVLVAPGGIAVLNEIENGLHYSVYEALWRLLGETARRSGTQIIATTHSYEFVKRAFMASQSDGDRAFALYRLEKDRPDRPVVRYSWDELAAALEYDLEIR